MLQWLPWTDAVGFAAATGAGWAGGRRAVRRRVTTPARRRITAAAVPWLRELTLMLVLYAMWQYAGALSIGSAGSARGRGEWIWHAERAVGVPSERAVQSVFLHHPGAVHWMNEYYTQVHVPALGLLLVWLFVRHRDLYPPLRNVVVAVTGASLLIQLLPVAPPRLIPAVGMVDTGRLIGPSDYARGAPGIDQLSAMPSVHVAWAVIVAAGIVWAASSRWRWLAVAHPAATLVTVVATGNHYWSDAAAACVICALAIIPVVRRHTRRKCATMTTNEVPALPAAEPALTVAAPDTLYLTERVISPVE